MSIRKVKWNPLHRGCTEHRASNSYTTFEARKPGFRSLATLKLVYLANVVGKL